MKKFMFAFAAVALFTGAQFASAATMTMNPSQHPVYSDPAKGQVVVIGYISNIDWDAAQAEQLRYAGLPVIAPDQTVKDETGIEYTCSNAGLSHHSCVSLVGETYYRNNMISMVKELASLGILNDFPRFFGWAKIAGLK